ncbi:uncharacterized protein [Centroberyx affinis]|uniref:uncharacterized protein n=1 Tax=Centroberyx affinis TaxID=166261 RepID=UPI003A5B9E9A
MPNIRQIKKRERKTRKWTPEAMEQAKQEVEAGRLTCRQAAKRFGVPKSSLSDRVSGRVASGCVHGQRPLLAPEDENSLVEYCLYSASHGFPLTKPQILAHALAIHNYRHPNNRKTAVGQTWWINFRERHHHRLTARTPDIIDRGRASCAKRGPINEYFRLLTATLEEHGLREKPRQIYNCDETGFRLDSMRRKVIVPRGTKHAYRQAQGTRDHITVLACFNAAGEDVPPFVIYKGGYPGGPYNKEGVPDALYGKSQAGYMDSELFRKWFVGHFLKFAAQERPLLLIMDGHQSHLDPELVRAAQREGVILLCLPPHTSHILQPLDVSFFGPLKADFSGLTGDLSAVSHSFLVSKKEFSRVLRDSYQRLKDRRVVVAGFRRCGLYPLDPTAIDWSRVMPSGPRRGTSSPPPPTPSASSWATPDATHPIQPPLSPVAPPPSPPATTTPAQTHPTPAPHPLSPPPVPNTQNPPPPPPANPYLTHPLVASGQITADLAHLLAEINYARNTGKVRRNTTKARILTAQEMSDAIEEAEDRAARREAQALARRDREQQRAEDTSPAATSSTLPGGSRPSRRTSLGAAPATSSGLPIVGPSTPLAPSCASHGPRLPAPSGTPSPTSLPAQEHQHHPPSPAGQADGWEEELDDDNDEDFWCFWCLDV